MTSYRLTPLAREGLARIVLYAEARFGGEVAGRVLLELSEAFDLLAASPAIGHSRQDLTPDSRIRFWSVGPSLIAYRSSVHGLEVLLVERGAIDWERRISRNT